MTIYQGGTLNTQALYVPGLYIDVLPPSVVALNGVATNIVGVVGTASWGPVNKATQVSSYATYAQAFGPLINRTNDMGTQIYVAAQQAANNFVCVRVTDGTDTAASVEVQTSCIQFSSIYTGSYGNNAVVTLAPGSTAGTTKVINSMPGFVSEVFDNISGTGNAFWVNMANAINLGQSVLRGPSQLVTATAGAGTASPPSTATQYALTGGTDGVIAITSAVLMGANTSPPTGVYALQNQCVSIGIIADLVDSTQWSALESFALSNGIYFIVTTAAGSTIAADVAALASAGAASYPIKQVHGDWVYWNDQVNQITRLVNPTAFFAGRLANLSPEQSSLNKPMYGIVATQKSTSGAASATYSQAELTTLAQAGIDCIVNPSPGGNYWSAFLGHNTSPAGSGTNGDNYTRLTNYIAASLQNGMGLYIGLPINNSLYADVTATLNNFLKNMIGAGILGYQQDGSLPFKVVCNASNNPFTQTSIGILTATVQVQYMAINEKFIINVQGGQGVTVTLASQTA